MDCLAGRKTAGRTTGDVRFNGHPQVFSTFARVSGYCEQASAPTHRHQGRRLLRNATVLPLWAEIARAAGMSPAMVYVNHPDRFR